VAYHSAATVGVACCASFIPIPETSPAQADLPVPYRLQAGVRYRANKRLAVEFDISRTGWSDFDTLVINNSLSPPAPSPVTSANSWSDANAYRLGASYQWDSKTLLRFGYTFDETPQPRDYFSARIPDSDRHLFSIGMSRAMGNGLELDAGYMFVKFKDYTHAAAGAGPVPGDPNGSIAYNGDYESSVHLFGVGVTKHF
jgi:long-chain fatty acid transport protein